MKKDVKEKPPLRILIIGSLPPPIGGTSVLLQSLIYELRTDDEVQIHIINTTSPRQKVGFFEDIYRVLYLIWEAAQQIRYVDIITLHAVSTKLCFTGTITLLFSKFFHKPLIIRKFGGTDYNDFPLHKRTITKLIISRCDMYLVETKYLLNVAIKDGIHHCRWFPNHRQLQPPNITNPELDHKCRRFVYISQVRFDKGIRELIEAGEQLNDYTSVNIFGPLLDGITEKMFMKLRKVKYHGVLKPNNVPEILKKYDALVLPTYHIGEGYPGVIIEAFSVGLPVITTNWGAIPEIVDETNGILVEPENSEALYEAMMRLCKYKTLYARLCDGAERKARQFSSEYWSRKFVEYCRDVAK